MISTLHIFKHRPEDYRKWLAVANITAKDCRKGKNKPHTRMSGAPTNYRRRRWAKKSAAAQRGATGVDYQFKSAHGLIGYSGSSEGNDAN